MGNTASDKDHELAERFLDAKALCFDLASTHTTAIVDNEKRREVRDHYRAIARSFYCGRLKQRSILQQVMLNKATQQLRRSRRQEERWERDLLAVYGDPHYPLERRRAALRELEQLRKQWEQLEEQQYDEIVRLSLVSGHHPSKSHRPMRRFKTEGRDRFFDRIDSVIRRYLKAKVKGASWALSTPIAQLATSMSLLQLLTLEWLRDKEALWHFLEACLIRWEEVADPKGVHRQSVRTHNICETRIALDDDGNNVLDPKQNILSQLASSWHEAGIFVEPNCLRQRLSRNIRKAKAELKNESSVTNLGVTHP